MLRLFVLHPSWGISPHSQFAIDSQAGTMISLPYILLDESRVG